MQPKNGGVGWTQTNYPGCVLAGPPSVLLVNHHKAVAYKEPVSYHQFSGGRTKICRATGQ